MTGPATGVPDRGTSGAERTTGTRQAASTLAILLASGFALRLIIAYLLPGSGFRIDLDAFRFWASNLAQQGPWGFYERPFFHDYTPGYLYVLWALGYAGQLLGGLGDLIKLSAILGDLAAAWLVHGMVMDLTGNRRRALLGAAIVLVNPITWFDSTIWGQVDSVGVPFLLLGLRELWRDRPERAAVFATIAAVVKPQLGILVPIVAAVVIGRALAGRTPDEAGLEPEVEEAGADEPARTGPLDRLRAFERRGPGPLRVVTTAVTGLLTGIVLAAPFKLSALDLLRQVAETAGGYPYLTVNAYNPWALVMQGATSLATTGQWLCDSIAGSACPPGRETLVGPFWAVAVGTALLLLAILATCVVVARRPDRRTILVGLAVLAIAFFVVPTRVHERYLYPCFALGAILAAISPRWRATYLVLTIANFANLYVVLTTLYPGNPSISDWLGIGPAIRSTTGVAIVVFAHLFGFLWAAAQLRRSARLTLADEVAGAEVEGEVEAVVAEAETTEAATAVGTETTGVMQAAGPGVWASVRRRLTERSLRPDRSRSLHGEGGGRLDRLDLWILAVLVIAALVLRTWRLAEPYTMHFDEVYHARTATEFLQKWRYGMDHDIYEWTHPHLAKYVMAGGIVLFGDDRVSATSSLGVTVRAAAVEGRWDDPVTAGRMGDRLFVATGSEVRAYDLGTRALVAEIPAPGASAVAVDPAGHVLWIGTDGGQLLSVDTHAMLDPLPRGGSAPATVRPVAVGAIGGSVARLVSTDDGQYLAAALTDGTLAAVEAATGEVLGRATVAGLADVVVAGTADAVIAHPAQVPDPAAAARALAGITGGDAATYEQRLRSGRDPVVLARAAIGNVRAALDAAIADGRLAGFSVEPRPRFAVAGSAGVTFVSAADASTVATVPLDAPATGLVLATDLDAPKLYVAEGARLAVVTTGDGTDAGAPHEETSFLMPGPVERVVYDEPSRMVHALGATPDGTGRTIYVVEPHANAVYADARLPFEPAALAVDTEPQYPSADRQQILALAADGSAASVEIGKHAFAWRLPGVIAGALTAGLIFLLARILFRRRSVGVLAAILTLADGMLFVQARIAMNDVYVGLFIVAGYTLFAALWTGRWRWRGAFWVAMPAIGLLMGLALASKWVGAFAIGSLGILILARSALGRVALAGAMVLLTTVLGYMAVSVPAGETSGGNLAFMLLMIVLTLVTVLVTVLHPIAWTADEVRFAIGAPAVAGVAVFGLAVARGETGASLSLGGTSVPLMGLAFALVAASVAVAGLLWLAGRLGFGPLAPPPGPDDPAALLPPPAQPAEGWLRPGWLFGLPVVWATVSLLAIPLAVYVVSYLPWAAIDGHAIVAGVPAGHTGQTLLDLTKQMYDYHNNLRAAHAASSPWWAWPFDLKPVWFYQGGFAGNTGASIYDTGTLVIWWLGIPAMAFASWQAYRRRSLGLALIAIGFACQWLPWARIDRATFQYHYYTSVPFIVLALAYLLAELWHGASARTWLVARLAAGLAVMGPMLMWLFKAPLCGYVRVDAAYAQNNLGSTSPACHGNPGSLVLTPQVAVLAIVLVVGIVALIRQLLALGSSGRGGPGGATQPGAPLTRIVVTAAATGVGIVVARLLPAATPILELPGFSAELLALVVLIPLGAIASFVATARDPRRFVGGAIVAIVGAFVILYPNIAALPLPSAVVNAYQGLLPTYLYPFMFPVNTDPVGPGPKLIAAGPAILLLALVVTCLVVGYSAWVWRVALAERVAGEADGEGDPEAGA